jgi:hypothetical protein
MMRTVLVLLAANIVAVIAINQLPQPLPIDIGSLLVLVLIPLAVR